MVWLEINELLTNIRMPHTRTEFQLLTFYTHIHCSPSFKNSLYLQSSLIRENISERKKLILKYQCEKKESCLAVLSWVTRYYAVPTSLQLLNPYLWNPKVWPFKAIEQYFPVVLFVMRYKVVLTFESVDEILIKCDHSNENYWTILPCGTVYYAIQSGSTRLLSL